MKLDKARKVKFLMLLTLLLLCTTNSFGQREILLLDVDGRVFNSIGKIHETTTNELLYFDGNHNIIVDNKNIKSDHGLIYHSYIGNKIILAKRDSLTLVSYDCGISFETTEINNTPIYPIYGGYGISKEYVGNGITYINLFLYNIYSENWEFISNLYTETINNNLISPILYSFENNLFFASKTYSSNNERGVVFYKSTNNGKNWSVINTSEYTFNILSIYFESEDIGYFITDTNEVYISLNGGDSWKKHKSFKYNWNTFYENLQIDSISASPFIIYKKLLVR